MREGPVVVIAEDAAQGPIGTLPAGIEVTLLLLGADPAAIAPDVPAAVTRIVSLPRLGWVVPTDALATALAAMLPGAGVVLLGAEQPARDLAGWLVTSLDAVLVWAVDALCPGEGTTRLDRVVLGGSHRLEHEVTADRLCLALTRGAAPAAPRPAGAPGPLVEVRDDVHPGASRVRVRPRGATPTGVDLGRARIVVSVGRGIGGPERLEVFQELAKRLGAGLGASRVAVDAGWVPFAHQVGQTGASVSPDVYLAFGISGAIQHLAGMRASGSVVAVNTDPDAPLCQVADLVVLGDAATVAERLLERLAARS